MKEQALTAPPWIGAALGTIIALVLTPQLVALWNVVNADRVSDYITVDAVQILDAVEGESPIVLPTGEIKKPFSAHWIVTVRQLTPTEILTACSPASGIFDYDPETTIQPRVTLDEWMSVGENGNVPCELKAGEYTVTTLLILHLPEGDQELRVVSNLFKVVPRPKETKA